MLNHMIAASQPNPSIGYVRFRNNTTFFGFSPRDVEEENDSSLDQ